MSYQQRIIKLRAWDQKKTCFVPLRCLLPGETRPIVQFTGMYDKNGAEIWEGDILHFSVTDIDSEVYQGWYEVVFYRGSFGTGLGDEFEAFSHLNLIQDTVVGNVFDTPQLLMRSHCQSVELAL